MNRHYQSGIKKAFLLLLIGLMLFVPPLPDKNNAAGIDYKAALALENIITPLSGAEIEQERIAGKNRYETAVFIAHKGWEQSDVVLLATGESFPDALSGAPLAAAYDAPLLLSRSKGLPEETKAALRHLGVKKVIVIGGPAAVADRAISVPFTRLAGNNRYETAVQIAYKLSEQQGGIPGRTAVITTGDNYPDALAASALAAHKGYPILLATRNAVPETTARALKELKIEKTLVIGGEEVISFRAAKKLPGVKRIAGSNRYDTAVAVMKYGETLGLDTSILYVATGQDYPDALSAGSLAGNIGHPLLLINGMTALSPGVQNWLTENYEQIRRVHIIGGENIVSLHTAQLIGSGQFTSPGDSSDQKAALGTTDTINTIDTADRTGTTGTTKESAAYNLGAPRGREIEAKITLSNKEDLASQNIRMEVPLITKSDSPYQKILVEHISPEPQQIIEGPAGGRRAVFALDRINPGKESSVKIYYRIKSYPVIYDFSNKGKEVASAFTKTNLTSFTVAADKIESDHPKIAAAAKQAASGAKNDPDRARRFYDFVNKHVRYKSSSPHRNKGALSALQNKEGVCEDMAALFVAMCRATGMPARIVNGYADNGRTGEKWNIPRGERLSLQGQRHSWAEFYGEGYGWIPVDPAFGQASGKDDYFGRLPAPSHLLQNYTDHTLKVSYQGGTPTIHWEESLVFTGTKP